MKNPEVLRNIDVEAAVTLCDRLKIAFTLSYDHAERLFTASFTNDDPATFQFSGKHPYPTILKAAQGVLENYNLPDLDNLDE